MKTPSITRRVATASFADSLRTALGMSLLIISGTAVGFSFYPDNPAKTIVLNLGFSLSDPLVYNSGSVATKPTGGYQEDPADVSVALIDVYGDQTGELSLPSPLRTRSYRADGTHAQSMSSWANAAVRFPFESNGGIAIIADAVSASEVSVDLKPVIRDFCIGHLADPDCYEADLEITSVQVVDPPPLVLLGQAEDYTVRTVMVNNGPESPDGGVDALFNQQLANVSPGISVSPAGGVVDEEAFGLLIADPRTDEQLYTITCLEPGEHSVTFTSSIAPLSAAVIDLDSANDSAAVTLTIDCAVPVTVNIKPHSFPNSINSMDDGSVPLAVLTTEQGEYGNPIAFDASTILGDTASFGEPGLAAVGNGAMEAHGRIHLKRSWEPDDRTRDKDDDALMHFPTVETGLVPGALEACIKGKFDDNGNLYTFYGCDSVNIVN